MVNLFSTSGAIIAAEFSAEYTSAELEIRNAFQSLYNRSTASAIWQNQLWTVNSELDQIIDNNNGALGTPADLPFQVVGVPLAELLGDEDYMALVSAPSTATPVMFVDLLDNATFPEGIFTLLEDRMLVGGFGDGSLQIINRDLDGSYLSAMGENGMVSCWHGFGRDAQLVVGVQL